MPRAQDGRYSTSTGTGQQFQWMWPAYLRPWCAVLGSNVAFYHRKHRCKTWDMGMVHVINYSKNLQKIHIRRREMRCTTPSLDDSSSSNGMHPNLVVRIEHRPMHLILFMNIETKLKSKCKLPHRYTCPTFILSSSHFNLYCIEIKTRERTRTIMAVLVDADSVVTFKFVLAM